MLLQISGTLHRHAKGWLVFILFLLDAAFMLFILPLGTALMKFDLGGPGPLDPLLFYTPARVDQTLAAYGEFGRVFYRNMELTVDLIYPIIYTLFFSLLISWLVRRGFDPRSSIQRWNVLPFGTWLFDLLENLGIVVMLTVFPAVPAALAWLTAGFTFIKWLFAGAMLALVVIGLAAAARNRFAIQA